MSERDPNQIELPIAPEGAIAVAYVGEVAFDYLQNWETCQQFANDGYRVVVVNDDSYRMAKDDIQKLCDHERALVADCFGEGYLK